jgi:hypothetical protein
LPGEAASRKQLREAYPRQEAWLTLSKKVKEASTKVRIDNAVQILLQGRKARLLREVVTRDVQVHLAFGDFLGAKPSH